MEAERRRERGVVRGKMTHHTLDGESSPPALGCFSPQSLESLLNLAVVSRGRVATMKATLREA